MAQLVECVPNFSEGRRPEVIEEIIEAGGDAYRFCFQCGLCDAVCPWNRVRRFSIRKIIREATFGLTEIDGEDIWRCTTCGRCPERCPRGSSRSRWGFPAPGRGDVRDFSRLGQVRPNRQGEPHI